MPSNRLRDQLVNVKDWLESKNCVSFAYKIPCADCTSSYIGQTGNSTRRLKEHKRDIAKNKKTPKALAEHTDNRSRLIDWESAAVIAKEK